MSNKHLFAAASLMAVALSASAQHVGSATADYIRADIQPSLTYEGFSTHGVDLKSNHSLFGIGADIIFGRNITGHSQPLFLEFGPELNYANRSEEVDYWDDSNLLYRENIKTRLLSLGTPLNVAYHYQMTDATVIAPFVGLNTKANLLAATYYNDIKSSTFDDVRRFQLGWNLGIGFYYNHFYLGYRYYSDLTPLTEIAGAGMTISNHALTIGFQLAGKR